jgi:hypothetical protein
VGEICKTRGNKHKGYSLDTRERGGDTCKLNEAAAAAMWDLSGLTTGEQITRWDVFQVTWFRHHVFPTVSRSKNCVRKNGGKKIKMNYINSGEIVFKEKQFGMFQEDMLSFNPQESSKCLL